MTDLQLLKRKKSRITAWLIVYAISAVIVAFYVSITAAVKLLPLLSGFSYIFYYIVLFYPVFLTALLYSGILISNSLDKCQNDINHAEREEKEKEKEDKKEKALASFPTQWVEVQLFAYDNPIYTFLINHYIEAIYVRKDYGKKIRVKIVYYSKVSKKKKKVVTEEWSLTLKEAEKLIYLGNFF